MWRGRQGAQRWGERLACIPALPARAIALHAGRPPRQHLLLCTTPMPAVHLLSTPAQVVTRLLDFLQRCALQLDVQLCLVGPANTAADGSPRCTALAVDLRTLAAYPTPPPPDQRGPLLPARHGQWIYALGGCADGTPLRPVYNARERRLELALLQGRPAAHLLGHCAALVDCSDEDLLRHWSTSPTHEPRHFCHGAVHSWSPVPLSPACVTPCAAAARAFDLPHPVPPAAADMRASFRWLLEQSGPALEVTHRFEWNPAAGAWQRLAAAGAAAAGAAVQNMDAQLAVV